MINLKNFIKTFLLLSIISTFSYAEEYNFVSVINIIEQEIGREVLPEIYKRLGIDVTKREILLGHIGSFPKVSEHMIQLKVNGEKKL